MAEEYSFKRLRKGVVAFVLVLAVFVLYRILFFKTEPPVAAPELELSELDTKLCLLVSSSYPINVDSVFVLGENMSKVYAYSSWDGLFKRTDTIFHIWYNGSQEVKRTVCEIEGLSCHSKLSADSLQAGLWSVDTKQKGILLNSTQFKLR
ncbi:hypothetical protein AGMMS49938_06300 [Fibrobacterales bacterium]|nr:hypothetical protein AGMMS49938_06300 [Fibrobacterales bacterium]